MKINVRRTGGFAGITEELGTIDTKSLTREASAKVQKHVADLARRVSRGDAPVGADMFRYELDVQQDDGKRRTIAVPESDPTTLPAPLRELLANL